MDIYAKKYRGRFQGWICGEKGNYAVYNEDGVTLGYHQDNKGNKEPEYTGTETGLRIFADAKEYTRGGF